MDTIIIALAVLGVVLSLVFLGILWLIVSSLFTDSQRGRQQNDGGEGFAPIDRGIAPMERQRSTPLIVKIFAFLMLLFSLFSNRS